MASPYGKGPYGKGFYSLAPEIDLSGALTVAVASQGALGVVTPLSGTLSIAPFLAADVSRAAGFVGTLPIAIQMAATFSNPVDFAAGLLARVVPGSLSDPIISVGFAGTLSVPARPVAYLGTNLALAGTLDASVDVVSPPMTAHPIWQDETPCPAPPWVELEHACNG